MMAVCHSFKEQPKGVLKKQSKWSDSYLAYQSLLFNQVLVSLERVSSSGYTRALAVDKTSWDSVFKACLARF